MQSVLACADNVQLKPLDISRSNANAFTHRKFLSHALMLALQLGQKSRSNVTRKPFLHALRLAGGWHHKAPAYGHFSQQCQGRARCKPFSHALRLAR
jgi:hypothetical protein